ncbi:DUF3047 domain-containing protein [Bradyrhizobium sp.]|uniref:DUF3047 domain-containing protein n=1 Tax=Bradyrhizobium sp. TaxID=376 RepID=UPI000A426AF2|nr:DUF3047 domain-containing protein [Bradyrhizobium sp.]
MNLKLLSAIFALGLLLANETDAADRSVPVGQFSKASLEGWERKAFKDETDYTLVYDSAKRSTVLQAVSGAAASGRFRKIAIDLTKTPFLNWSWKVSDPLVGNDENAKGGDDFSARLYVVAERGIMGVTSLSVNYVWASQHPTGSSWPSPFTKRVRLIAMNSGSTGLNGWISHKRNVRDDLRNQFGEDITAIDAVALMTDTDNSGGRARAYYGDIWFTAE